MPFVLAHFGNVIRVCAHKTINSSCHSCMRILGTYVIRVCAQNNKLFMSFVLAHFGNVIRVCAQNNKLFMPFVLA